MPNLTLLGRIARGERVFSAGRNPDDGDYAAFDQLVRDARELVEAGYLGALRPMASRVHGIERWYKLVVLPPGVTSSGREALRGVSLDDAARHDAE